MFEQPPDPLRQKVNLLAKEALQKSDPTAWFEVLYSQANGDSSQIPWAKLTPHPYLQSWLDNHQIKGENRSALVIGCGLGDDAEALQKIGFQVTAFDISPTAIAWCQKRFPDSQVNYTVADLFALNPEWNYTFDFVFECRNIQALPLSVRTKVIEAIASLVKPKGKLLIITHFRDNEIEPDSPPWPLSGSELAQFQKLGLQEMQRDTFYEVARQNVKQLRIEYIRPEN